MDGDYFVPRMVEVNLQHSSGADSEVGVGVRMEIDWTTTQTHVAVKIAD